MRDLIGRTLGHYRIVEHLGGGGMGVVYKAEDTKLGRTVALKFLPPEWSRDPDARERFLREARAASALEDSRICTIHDIDETDDGQLFIAMAFYEGETLKKRLERGRLPIGRAVDIAIQVAEGLERAHTAEIIHRDIKPANLMLTGRDEVVIVDFGLAKLAGEHGLTQTGATVGTPHYMSPEQAKGTEVGLTTDIWSLGVVLYEMVTGERPFKGDNADAVVHSILHNEPKRLRSIQPDTPSMLDRIVGRAMEKDPKKRYPTVEDLLTDLRTLKATESQTGLMTTTIDTAGGRRRRLVARLGLIFLVVFAIALTWVLSKQSQAPAEPEPLPRIVVLPFENLGPPEDEYFADGITEEITSRLAAVSGLQVISRTSAMQYKEQRPPLPRIGEELDVGYVLEGTIRWDRGTEDYGRVRITPQLIRVADDSHLWSERYDRVLENIFTVQSDIAEQVISQLQATILEPERRAVEARLTDNMEAYQAYLLGIQYWRMGEDESYIRQMLETLERAVELDPDFAQAHAALCEAHSQFYHYRLDFTPERLEKARMSAERALQLQPGLPEGHRALGFYYYWGFRDYDGALEQFATAAEGLPNDADLLSGIFGVSRRQGHWDEALLALENWLNVDPHSYLVASEASQTFRHLREFAKAEGEMRRAIAIAPDRPDAYYSGTANYLLWDGATDRARHLLELAPSLDSPYIEYRSLLLDLYDRKPESVLARLESESIDAISLDYWYLPRELLECICLTQMSERRPADAACSSAVELIQHEIEARPHDYRLYHALGHALALLGRKEEAVVAGEHAVELIPTSKDALVGPNQAIELAKIYTQVGETDKALDLIDELLSIPCDLSVGLLRLDPVWDPLRDHPRFQALLEEYEVEQ